jgi:hypothetical protein
MLTHRGSTNNAGSDLLSHTVSHPGASFTARRCAARWAVPADGLNGKLLSRGVALKQSPDAGASGLDE